MKFDLQKFLVVTELSITAGFAAWFSAGFAARGKWGVAALLGALGYAMLWVHVSLVLERGRRR